MRARRWLLLLLPAGLITPLLAFAQFGSLWAHTPLPKMTRTKVVANGKYLFVMVSPHPVEQEARWVGPNGEKKVRELRKNYPESGLYLNDGSREPLWTIDWYRHHIDLASDGVHLVRPGTG